jgi:hypothetical protein
MAWKKKKSTFRSPCKRGKGLGNEKNEGKRAHKANVLVRSFLSGHHLEEKARKSARAFAENYRTCAHNRKELKPAYPSLPYQDCPRFKVAGVDPSLTAKKIHCCEAVKL